MPCGREGHARVVVLTVIPVEMEAAMDALDAHREVGETGAFTSEAAMECWPGPLPFVVSKCDDRSNTPAGNSARNLLEDWRPETLILTGIAGGIRRIESVKGIQQLDGPNTGDVVVAEMIHFGDYGKDLPDGFLPRWLPLVHPPTRLVHRHTDWLCQSTTWADHLSDKRPAPGRPRVLQGELIAVEAVAGNPFGERQQQWIEHFDQAIAVDMESMGVGRALHDYDADVGVHYHPRWLCVRGISDQVVGSKDALKLLGTDDNNDERREWKRYAALTAAEVTKLIVSRLVKRARPEHPLQPAIDAWP